MYGVHKCFNSRDGEGHEKHGLPLMFYKVKRQSELDYQTFLLDVRRGFFEQAYKTCSSRKFMPSHYNEIENMLVLEEFYRKNNF